VTFLKIIQLIQEKALIQNKHFFGVRVTVTVCE